MVEVFIMNMDIVVKQNITMNVINATAVEKLKQQTIKMIKLICNNAMTELKNIEDKSIDLVVTDPPYNVKKNYGTYKDNLKPKEYIALIENLINEFKRISNNKIVIVLGSKMLRDWWNYVPDAKLIIVKMGAVSNNKIKNLSLQFHCILTTVKSYDWISDIWTDIRWPGEGYFFNEPRYGHPAMTPLKLTKRLLRLFSRENDTILDPFTGSGTTGVACKAMNRNFIGIEIEPKYVEIANKRIANTFYQEELLCQ
jgi:site-specific DNA-methyltransferase (adenine-specific)